MDDWIVLIGKKLCACVCVCRDVAKIGERNKQSVETRTRRFVADRTSYLPVEKEEFPLGGLLEGLFLFINRSRALNGLNGGSFLVRFYRDCFIYIYKLIRFEENENPFSRREVNGRKVEFFSLMEIWRRKEELIIEMKMKREEIASSR